MTRAHLAIVAPQPEQPEEALGALVPALVGAERRVAVLRQQIDQERRRLAVKRGVAFIREEAVRREFGHG